MCGIHLTLSAERHILPNVRTRELLRRRGPDSSRELRRTCSVSRNGVEQTVYITCYSTVLALRGNDTVPQPVTSSNDRGIEPLDDFLCWNGEAWRLFDEPVLGNDSEVIFDILSRASTKSLPGARPEPTVVQSLAKVKGPYAFAFYHSTEQKISFGRDPLGRRSLMSRVDEHGNFFLTSVADSNELGWQEVEADGLYSIDVLAYLDYLSSAESTTSEQLPFLKKSDHLGDRQAGTTVDIVDEAFQSAEALKVAPQKVTDGVYHSLSATSAPVQKLESLLRMSLRDRISTIPKRFHTQSVDPVLAPTTLAVLFSGGLDCTVLARLATDVLDCNEPIDLLNVAFENPRVHRRPANDAELPAYSPFELCPDRITGRASFAELQKICPHRQWRFVAINVPYEETLAHRSEVISLIHPHNTEMDLSIACALYFAARGSGLLTLSETEQTPISYTTHARVLLSGLGADELFGGYQRHATAFARHGPSGLLEELELDVARLGKRNLGRDDRVLSNWARETRFPFLDEDLVKWAIGAPVWERCDFGVPAASDVDQVVDASTLLEPGKKVLRCLAWKLQMEKVAGEKKRAIQFGARTAKMEVGGKLKGTQLLT